MQRQSWIGQLKNVIIEIYLDIARGIMSVQYTYIRVFLYKWQFFNQKFVLKKINGFLINSVLKIWRNFILFFLVKEAKVHFHDKKNWSKNLPLQLMM